jgi:hypothetical protein
MAPAGSRRLEMDDPVDIDEKRWEKLMSIMPGGGSSLDWFALNALFEYLDEHEPAVGDALRYGVAPIKTIGIMDGKQETGFIVNYPKSQT